MGSARRRIKECRQIERYQPHPTAKVTMNIKGDGSKPVIVNFSGMNIHWPAILGFSRCQGFDQAMSMAPNFCCAEKKHAMFKHTQTSNMFGYVMLYIYVYILHILNYIISHYISMFISITVGFRSLFAWLKHASQAQIIFRWQPWLWWKKHMIVSPLNERL